MNYTIIVAAGKGKRMNNKINKILLQLNNKQIIYHSIKPFEDSPLIDKILLIANKDDIIDLNNIIKTNNFKKTEIIEGGEKRQDSVYNGLKLLKNAKQDITNVSVLLQTGKDREAMQAIINFSELTQSLLRIFSNVQLAKELSRIKFKNKSFEQFYGDFNKNLHELISAFEKKDFVLIGDLLEYEIAPSIEEIIHISKKILKQPKG